MEYRKMLLNNIFTGQQRRHRYREKTSAPSWEGECWINGESSMKTYTLQYVASGNFLYDSGNSNQYSVTT